MKKSVIYIIVLLTMFSLSCTLIPGAFSQTDNVKIVSYSWYVDSVGMLDVVGEVQNVGTTTIASASLSGTATTTDGAQTVSSTMVWVQELLPQQKAPFYMTFIIQSGQTSSTTSIANIALSVVTADTTTNYQYPDLKITTHSYKIGTGIDDKGIYWVTGTLKNTGSQTAQNVRVLGTFYDASDNVLAVGGYTQEVLTASLSPSATIDFKFGAYDMNQTLAPSDQKIAKYTLLIQTEGPLLQGTAPQITPYPTAISSPGATTSPTGNSSPSGTASPTDSQDSVSNPLGSIPASWIYVVIIVIVIVVIVGAVLALKKRKPQEVSNKKEENK